MQKIYILVTTFNRLRFTKECLESLKKQNFRNFQVIVIDSGSTDGTVEYVRDNYQSAITIQGNSDWWWTKATNEGLDLALRMGNKNDYVLLLNDDCVASPKYLSQLLSTAKKYPNALIGSLCVKAQSPTKVVEAGIRIDWPSGLVYSVTNAISSHIKDYKRIEVISQLDALPGKGTLIPFKIFIKTGIFNVAKLPHYISDYEFSNRAKRLGFELLVDPKAVLKHYWEATGLYSRNNQEKRNIVDAWKLMFGRKSMNNIVDWLNFIELACPPKLRLKNYYLTFWRIFNGVLSMWPVYYFRPFILWCLLMVSHIIHLTRRIIKMLTRFKV